MKAADRMTYCHQRYGLRTYSWSHQTDSYEPREREVGGREEPDRAHAPRARGPGDHRDPRREVGDGPDGPHHEPDPLAPSHEADRHQDRQEHDQPAEQVLPEGDPGVGRLPVGAAPVHGGERGGERGVPEHHRDQKQEAVPGEGRPRQPGQGAVPHVPGENRPDHSAAPDRSYMGVRVRCPFVTLGGHRRLSSSAYARWSSGSTALVYISTHAAEDWR